MIETRIWARRLAAAVTCLVVVAGCGGTAASPAASGGDPAKDKLAQVLARGTLVLWTDTEYPPQSFKVDGAARSAGTKCAPNQLTAPEVSGYDAETGKLVATSLGVEPCFVTTPFDSMIAGGWGDRFDVAWGSGAITSSRLEKLYVTQPYYSTPASFFVAADSAVTKPDGALGQADRGVRRLHPRAVPAADARAARLHARLARRRSEDRDVQHRAARPRGRRRAATSTRSSAASRSASPRSRTAPS